MKKRRVATAALTAAMIGIMGFSTPVFAAAGYGAAKAELNKGSKTVTIGNDAITRTFSFKDGKLRTELIENKLGHTTLKPGDGSEEFYIEGLVDPVRKVPATPLASVKPGAAQAPWTVETTSDQGTGDGGGINALIDGNTGSYWHSNYGGGTGTDKVMPVDVTLDRGANGSAFSTLGYFPRSTSANGNWQEFELFASDTKEGLFNASNQLKASNGSSTFKVSYVGMYGSGDETGAKWNYFGLKDACDKRFVGVRVTKGQGGNFAAGGELDLFSGDPFTSCEVGGGDKIKSSDLKLAGDPAVSNTSVTLNGEKKRGKLITFAFEPFAFGADKNAKLEQKVVMYDGDHFMRKWLEFKTSDESVRVKFIDGEHIEVADDAKTWTAPRNKGGVVAMDMEKSVLGQPVYINGMFMGSEFPETDTQISDKVARPRYWTGKNFADFKRDGQLSDDGKYVSWQTVLGASHSNGSDMNVIQTDFYAYITSISKPSDFRIQYNSWFDNMMFIDDENIIESFKAVDKQLSETGVRPLESYVVDDGWNQYRKNANQYTTGDDLRRNGEVEPGELGVNNSGFWQFNNKFPDGLTPSSKLVRKLGSNFGVWIGPRGGYNYYGNLASIIADANKGSAAGGSIDVADQRYVDNFSNMAVKWMKDYRVNYWKWDGYADGGQFNAFKSGEDYAAYNEDHQHMEGGPSHFFHVTDLWEKWIVLFDRVWETASDEQIEDLWISLTCYVNPSPWFLQWSNSVWMQCVGDRGEVHNGVLNDKMNTMLTYRDACYYDFIKNHEFQFPLANLYNHDPIYGKEGTGITADSMDGEQFRNYMYMMGTRGTAFWELYYSDSIFDDEKYLVNADFLEWEEGNFEMLRNAKWIGGTPSSTTALSSSPISHNPGEQYAYGFAGFNSAGNEGIISMRNPGKTAAELTFKLDAGIGCTASGTYHVVRDHVYTEGEQAAAEAPATVSQGQDVSITLQPGEVQIWHLSKDGDTVAPKLTKLYTEDNNILRVQASEHVYGAQFEVLVNGERIELAEDAVRAYADLRTFDIALPKVYADGARVEVKATAGADASGNKLDGAVNRMFHVDGVVGRVVNPVSANLVTAEDSITGVNGFAVEATVSNPVAGKVLVSQGDEWSLGIDAKGKAYFTVGDVTATSDASVKGATSIAGVRENNGMLKVYVAGEIEGNKYDAEKSLNHEVAAAPIKIDADAGLQRVAVYDRSLGYDEVASTPLADLVNTVEALEGKTTPESWNEQKIDELLAKAKVALKSGDAAQQQSAYEALLAGYNKLMPGLGEPKVENLALHTVPTASWLPGSSATGDAANSGSPLTNATDGKNNSATPHAIFGADAAKQPAYMQIDLGGTATIDSVKLWRYWSDNRQYADTAVVVSSTPDFAEKTVLYYSYADAAHKDVFGLGEDATQQPYTETADGKELFKASGEPVKARYVRLYGNGKIGGVGGDNHIVELQVFGTREVVIGDPFGVDELEALIARGNTALANKDKYSADTIKNLEGKVKAAEELAKKVRAEIEKQSFTVTHGEFNAVRDELQSALAALVRIEKPAEVVPVYSVVFDDMVEGTQNTTVSVLKGDKVASFEAVREGYMLEGWYTDAEYGTRYDFDAPVMGDLTLYAKWSKVEDGQDAPSVPGTPEGQHGQGSHNGASKPGSLPSTGDNAMLMVGGVIVVAVIALGAGLYLKRKNK